jgi:hypothetical protein
LRKWTFGRVQSFESAPRSNAFSRARDGEYGRTEDLGADEGGLNASCNCESFALQSTKR